MNDPKFDIVLKKLELLYESFEDLSKSRPNSSEEELLQLFQKQNKQLIAEMESDFNKLAKEVDESFNDHLTNDTLEEEDT